MSTFSAAQIAHVLGQPAPTAEQTAVIEAALEPMLVIAGAGSGKTETMAARVVYLVANDLLAPSEILGLTFTRKAASELSVRIRARLQRLARHTGAVDISADNRPRIATYNSYAAGIVTDHGLRLGIDPDATLLSAAGRYQIAEDVVATWPHDLHTTSAVSTVTAAVADLAAQLGEHGLQPQQAAARMEKLAQIIEAKDEDSGARKPGPKAEIGKVIAALRTRSQLMELVVEFDRRKRAAGVVDFTDQVRMAATIAQQVPAVGQSERAQYRAVLLDEYQDTSIAQVDLLRALFGAGHPVTAVGDPNQAIYGWRGAAAGTLLEFPHDFPPRYGTGRIEHLSTAWRNDLTILSAANRLAAPLRTQNVTSLHPRPGAGPGHVQIHYAETRTEETTFIAEVLQQAWRPGETSAAVLCRKRSHFGAIEESLTRAGIPCEIVGLSGLLATAEVADVRAAMQVAHDPSRGEAMMRLLTGPSVNLGAADLQVLSDWSKRQARNAATASAGPAPDDGREAAEESSLVEAVDRLPGRDWASHSGRRLSDSARRRLQHLAGVIRQVRAVLHLSVPEVVTTTEYALGLDIEVVAAVAGSAAHARRHLDAFATAAAEYAAGTLGSPTVGGFLAYLEIADEQERGLEVVAAEPDPEAVQIMTVHAAKGLEWDWVAVPGMSMGDFPSLTSVPGPDKPVTDSGWLTSIGALPYLLRGDADSLPPLAAEEALTHRDMAQAREEFRAAEGQRQLYEERRLAYVALTRARQHLLLTGAFWASQSKPRRVSPFLTELASLPGADLSSMPGCRLPQHSAHETNPNTEQEEPIAWPQAAPTIGAQWQDLWASAQEHQRHRPVANLTGVSHQGRQWWREAELLLAERDRAGDLDPGRPGHLSASAVVALANDPEAFELSRRRPIPRQPSVQARRGTQFHAWVEQHFGSQALLDWEEMPGAEDESVGSDAELRQLQQAFLASRWANATPVGIETDIETPVDGVMVRCRIDAVFATDAGVHIVDWKTGTPPRDPHTLRSRQMQLALYRIAWSRLHQTPLEAIQASLVYVATGETVDAGPLTEEDVREVLRTFGQ